MTLMRSCSRTVYTPAPPAMTGTIGKAGEFSHSPGHAAGLLAVHQTWPDSAAAKFNGYGFDIELSPAVELRWSPQKQTCLTAR